MKIVKKILVSRPINCNVRPPGSKSITNRALVCAALSDHTNCLSGVLDSEDTRVMIDALRSLGLTIDHNPEQKTICIEGCGGIFPNKQTEIYVANSGTTARFLTAVLATTKDCSYRIHGKSRMHERPIGDLISALHQLGADVRSESENNCPPVLISQNGVFAGDARISGEISSQFLSALLMAAPLSSSEVVLSVEGELVSKPYIKMTLEVMRAFGARVDAADDFSQFHVATTTRYTQEHTGTFRYDVEPDASAASYFFAAAVVTGGTVTVNGLSKNSLQGDMGFCDCLEQMGCQVQYDVDSTTVTAPLNGKLRGITVDMNAISDTVMTLGVVALFAQGVTRVTNVAHIRHKETDRIAALACELRKFGAVVTEFDDGLEIVPPTEFPDGEIVIDTYDDHRIAMSFAIAGLRISGVLIRDPDCVVKTYPGFFADLEKASKSSYESPVS